MKKWELKVDRSNDDKFISDNSIVVFGVTILLVIILFGALAIYVGNQAKEDVMYDSTSESEERLYTEAFELSKTGDGINTVSAQVYNQTWLNFDGVNDYIRIANDSDVCFNSTSNLTVSIWVYINNFSTSQGLFYFGNSTRAIDFYLDTKTLEPKFQYRNSTQSLLYKQFGVSNAPNIYQLNNLILSWNNSYVEYYLNGVYKYNTTIDLLNTFNCSFVFGQFSDNTNFDYNGSLYAIQIFNQTFDRNYIKDIYFSYKKNLLNYSINKTSLGFQYGPLFMGNNDTLYLIANKTLYKSSNAMLSTSLVHNFTSEGFTTARSIYQSKLGDLYVDLGVTGNISISLDNGLTWNNSIQPFVCQNLTGNGYSVMWYMDEDNEGNLYLAEYGPGVDNCAYIHKSTDRGRTWTISYNSSYYNWTANHTHLVYVDPYTNYIYATTGDNPPHSRLIRSVDKGITWTSLLNGSVNHQFTNIISTPNYRLFFSDSLPNYVYRTSDDINFNIVYTAPIGYNSYSWVVSKDNLGNLYYGTVTSDGGSKNYLLFSPDEGSSWYTLENYLSAPIGYTGYRVLTSFDSNGNAYLQDSSRNMSYKFNLINNYNPNKLLYFNINENSGTTAYDSSGNGNNATISGATWQNDGVLNTLTSGVDYTVDLVTGLLTIINSDYLYEYLFVDYDYNKVFGFHVSILNVIAGFLMIVVLGVGIIYVVKYFKNIKELE